MRFVQTLQKAGLRVTGPRLRVLAALQEHERRHLSVEEVHESLRNRNERASLATIYRVLGQLTDAGVLRRHVFAHGHPIYEIDEGEEHHHLVCVECGRVEAFRDELLREAIADRKRTIFQSHGYALSRHELTLYGSCEQCRAPKHKGGRPSVATMDRSG